MGNVTWKQAIDHAKELGFVVEEFYLANGRREQVRLYHDKTTKGGSFYVVRDLSLWLRIFESTPFAESH